MIGALLSLVACGPFGVVEQGRVVAFDAEQHTVTVALDRSPAQGVVDYTGAVATYHLPSDPHERGADPAVGGLVKVDAAGGRLWIVDAGTVREVGGVEVQDGVDAKDPRVWDAERGQARSFPAVDAATGTVALWFAKERRLVTVRPSAGDLALPAATWAMGDEVRLYRKEPERIARFMNVTRTDIYKK